VFSADAVKLDIEPEVGVFSLWLEGEGVFLLDHEAVEALYAQARQFHDHEDTGDRL
jgi:hypothetical protein